MKTKTYYFALGDILNEAGLKKTEARVKFGFDKEDDSYISKTGFQKLCTRPAQIRVETLNTICAAMKLAPGELWRAE